MKTFAEEFFNILKASLDNNHQDNFDYVRFRQPPKDRFVKRAINNIKGYVYKKYVSNSSGQNINEDVLKNVLEAGILFDLLNDAASKKLLLCLLAYRLLGYKKVKLPTNTVEYHKTREAGCAMVDVSDQNKIDLNVYPYRLYKVNMDSIGYPITMYRGGGPTNVFILKQYEYLKEDGEAIKAKDGETVIDAGACYGDTALYFACEVGETGKVFSFEFVPGNLAILEKNLSLNPDLAQIIHVIEKPLWEKDDLSFYIIDKGPASKVRMEPIRGAEKKVVSYTIDTLARVYSLETVDFIKMDIEGAELSALRGAEKVIRKYRPKLAISVYHKIEDFHQIPEFINSLNLGYKFYLKHNTIHHEETVLFAEVDASSEKALCKI